MAPYQFRPPNDHNGAHLKSKILFEGSATLVGLVGGGIQSKSHVVTVKKNQRKTRVKTKLLGGQQETNCQVKNH